MESSFAISIPTIIPGWITGMTRAGGPPWCGCASGGTKTPFPTKRFSPRRARNRSPPHETSPCKSGFHPAPLVVGAGAAGVDDPDVDGVYRADNPCEPRDKLRSRGRGDGRFRRGGGPPPARLAAHGAPAGKLWRPGLPRDHHRRGRQVEPELAPDRPGPAQGEFFEGIPFLPRAYPRANRGAGRLHARLGRPARFGAFEWSAGGRGLPSPAPPVRESR